MTHLVDLGAGDGPGLLRLLARRPARWRPDRTVPHIEARMDARARSTTAWRDVCGWPGGNALPLPWPAVLAAPLHRAILGHPAFPLHPAGVVHVRQQITRHRLVAEHTPLSLRAWVEGHRTVRAGGEIDLHTEARLDDGVVWSAVTTLLSRAIPGDRTLPRAPAPEAPDGDPARIVAVEVPADLGRRYAAVSGDANPIHTHALAARMSGFRAPIAHGMWTLARALVEVELPAACRLTARFEAPAFLPGALRLAVHPREDGGSVVVTGPDGRRHATVRVEVPARPGSTG